MSKPRIFIVQTGSTEPQACGRCLAEFDVLEQRDYLHLTPQQLNEHIEPHSPQLLIIGSIHGNTDAASAAIGEAVSINPQLCVISFSFESIAGAHAHIQKNTEHSFRLLAEHIEGFIKYSLKA